MKNLKQTGFKDQLSGAKLATPTIAYSILGGVSMILAFIVHFGYNSVQVLQHRIYVPAISNSIWIVYFFLVSLRSIVLAIVYSHNFHKHEGYFLTNWIFGSFEIMFFCLALNYQRRFRAVGNIAIEPEDNTSDFVKFFKMFTLHEGVLMLQFLIIMIAIILFQYTEDHATWFWVYVALSLFLVLNALVISIIIACRKGYDEPAWITKVYFVVAVLLCAPERVPIFVWKQCVHESCWHEHFDIFELFLLFKIISVFFIFHALYKEYHRLKHESQYALLNEVPSYTYHKM